MPEYTLRDIHKPIGISAYELTRALPENLKSSLPTVEEIEAELTREGGGEEDFRAATSGKINSSPFSRRESALAASDKTL